MAAHIRNVGEVASNSSESSTMSVRSASEARDGGKSTGEIGLFALAGHFEVVALSDAEDVRPRGTRSRRILRTESNRPYSPSRSGRPPKTLHLRRCCGPGRSRFHEPLPRQEATLPAYVPGEQRACPRSSGVRRSSRWHGRRGVPDQRSRGVAYGHRICRE